MARPSKLTPEVAQRLENALRNGSYIGPACDHAGIVTASYYNWLDRGRVELKRIDQAERALDGLPKRAPKANRAAARRACGPLPSEQPYLSFLERATRASADAELHAVGVLRSAMTEDWRAALAYLERRYPARWRRVTDTTAPRDDDDAGSGSETAQGGPTGEIAAGDGTDPDTIALWHELLARRAGANPARP